MLICIMYRHKHHIYIYMLSLGFGGGGKRKEHVKAFCRKWTCCRDVGELEHSLGFSCCWHDLLARRYTFLTKNVLNYCTCLQEPHKPDTPGHLSPGRLLAAPLPVKNKITRSARLDISHIGRWIKHIKLTWTNCQKKFSRSLLGGLIDARSMFNCTLEGPSGWCRAGCDSAIGSHQRPSHCCQNALDDGLPEDSLTVSKRHDL